MNKYLVKLTSKNVNEFVLEAENNLEAMKLAMDLLLDEIDDSIVEVSFEIKNINED